MGIHLEGTIVSILTPLALYGADSRGSAIFVGLGIPTTLAPPQAGPKGKPTDAQPLVHPTSENSLLRRSALAAEEHRKCSYHKQHALSKQTSYTATQGAPQASSDSLGRDDLDPSIRHGPSRG